MNKPNRASGIGSGRYFGYFSQLNLIALVAKVAHLAEVRNGKLAARRYTSHFTGLSSFPLIISLLASHFLPL
jgi:hypothetical protein